jgi:hypothetical protein
VLFAFHTKSEGRTPSFSMRGPSASSLYRYIRRHLLKFSFLGQDRRCRLDRRKYSRPDIIYVHITDKRDRKLTQQWVIWLTQRDPERSWHPSSLSHLGMLTAHAQPGLIIKSHQQTPRDVNRRTTCSHSSRRRKRTPLLGFIS